MTEFDIGTLKIATARPMLVRLPSNFVGISLNDCFSGLAGLAPHRHPIRAELYSAPPSSNRKQSVVRDIKSRQHLFS